MLGPETTGVKVFAVCVAVLFFKFLVTARLQAVNTFLAGGRPPEDNQLAEMMNKTGPTQGYGIHMGESKDEKEREAFERSERWKRIVANDVEWIPLGLLVFGTGLVIESQEMVQVVALIVFTVTRCSHTIAYANSMQPHRSFIWIVSVLAAAVGAGNVLVSVFAK